MVAIMTVAGILASGSGITGSITLIDLIALIGVFVVSATFCSRCLKKKWVILAPIVLVIACKVVFPQSGSWYEIGLTVVGIMAPILVVSAMVVLGKPAIVGSFAGVTLLAISGIWGITHAGASAKGTVIALLMAFGLLLFVIAVCSYRSKFPASGFQSLRSASVTVGRIGGTRFNGALLSGADFFGARLVAANFGSAVCTGVRWPDKQHSAEFESVCEPE